MRMYSNRLRAGCTFATHDHRRIYIDVLPGNVGPGEDLLHVYDLGCRPISCGTRIGISRSFRSGPAHKSTTSSEVLHIAYQGEPGYMLRVAVSA